MSFTIQDFTANEVAKVFNIFHVDRFTFIRDILETTLSIRIEETQFKAYPISGPDKCYQFEVIFPGHDEVLSGDVSWRNVVLYEGTIDSRKEIDTIINPYSFREGVSSLLSTPEAR
jgi:hypothetical protein